MHTQLTFLDEYLGARVRRAFVRLFGGVAANVNIQMTRLGKCLRAEVTFKRFDTTLRPFMYSKMA